METVSIETQCLHELFESQVAKRPMDIALICGKEKVTYQELENKANQLSHFLHSTGITSGSLVGLYLDRSIHHVIAILAILKAGAGYVPIDPNYPMDRIKHIFKDSAIRLLITENIFNEDIKKMYSGNTFLIDSDSHLLEQQLIEPLHKNISCVLPHDICYVIYTSGSTGHPKGVMTEHRNVVSFIQSFNQKTNINSNDKIYHGFSLGFDGSVEEMWMALSNGATLVIGTKDIVRFPNEVVHFIQDKEVTVFSTVPTFLSMINEDVPSIRLLIVSGEQCSQDLVKKWAQPGRRMLNVYGPTETTVNTTVEECKAGKPVTIGKPLPGYTTYVLDPQMKPVKPLQPGELCIGGVGVSRGYLNQKELTEKHFVTNPYNGTKIKSKLYKTGDLVRQDQNGDLIFMQRMDTQVKVRGFRVELSEIETVLQEHALIRQAVVKVIERADSQDLAAYVVKQNNAPLDNNDILKLLRSRLPYYMIPSFLDTLESMPRLTSGKINRNALPKPRSPLIKNNHATVEPTSNRERSLVELYQKLFQLETVSIIDDFFLDLGGHSLLAAKVVTLLRNELKTNVAIRTLYQYPTIKKLAAYLDKEESKNAAREKDSHTNQQTIEDTNANLKPLSTLRRFFCYGLQALSIFLVYSISTIPVVAFYLLYRGVKNGSYPIELVLGIGIGLFLGTYPFILVLSIIIKWLVIGRYKAGTYPLWSFYYFKWWFVSRFQSLSGAGFLEGTPLMGLYCRLMGANIGRGCILDTSQISIFDLIRIGNNTSIGSETSILGYTIEKGNLILGTITIGSNCFIGMHSYLAIHSIIDNNAKLDDLSLLGKGDHMKSYESRKGSPSIPSEVYVPAVPKADLSPRHPFLFGLFHFGSMYLLEFFVTCTALPSILLLYSAYKIENLYYWIGVLVLSIPLFEITFCVFLAIVKALVLPKTKPGMYSTETWFYLRKWFIDSLLNMSRLLILPIYTTLYLPPWLRMLGAKIGHRAELSIVGVTSPDLLNMKDESFFADGSNIGGNRYYKGHLEIAPNTIGKRSFIGNNALIPGGRTIGNNCLLGVLSIPPCESESKQDKGEWLGSPPFALPHRDIVGGFTEEDTYTPSKKRVFQRLLIDTLRIIIPSTIEILGLIALISALVLLHSTLSIPLFLFLMPGVLIGISIAMALCVVFVKNMLIGEFKPVIKPLWSPYVWLNEVINGAYEAVAVPVLSPLLGTPFFAWYLRMLGCTIGKNVYLGTSLFGEFDLVEIGDHAAIGSGVVIQNHLFEDRIFKSSRLTIEKECTVSAMSVVLYDSKMQRGSTLGPLSLLMKGEILPPSSTWQGIPTSTKTIE